VGNRKRYTVAIDTGFGGTKIAPFRHAGSKKNEQEPESHPEITDSCGGLPSYQPDR
jgi:hypothetical protein